MLPLRCLHTRPHSFTTMISAFANTLKVPELRSRIFYTLALIIIIRLGVHITLPGVDSKVIADFLEGIKQDKSEGGGSVAGIGAMLNIFSGGGLTQCGIFALGIMPYISASIMMQLMTAVIPKLSRLGREDGGREKINQYTRWVTVAIATVQGFMLAKGLQSPDALPYLQGITKYGVLVPNPSWLWVFMTVLTIVAGSLLLMWIGDQLTEKGIGNGTSLIITVNIIAALPGALVTAWRRYVGDATQSPFDPIILILLFAGLLFIIAAVIAITQAQRRIAIQYAKRVVGRKQFGGQTQYLPLKVNYAGVMPIIFATAVLSLPTFALSFFQEKAWAASIISALAFGGWVYYLVAGLMIFFFSFFWVATMFQPSQISEDLKRSGGYIPGVRPGKPTADFLDFTMTRLTAAGAIFLTLIFLIPGIIASSFGLDMVVTQFFGGTSLLILVGVLLDMMRQVETHLIQRHYDGFLRKGKMKSGFKQRQQNKVGGSGVSSTTTVYLWAFAALLILISIVAWASK